MGEYSLITLDNEVMILLMAFAVMRVYLEIINFKFDALPLTRSAGERFGKDHLANFHRFGLYMSIGFIILFAPEVLFYQ